MVSARGESARSSAWFWAGERILLVRGQPEPLFEQEACNGQADWLRAVQSLLTRTQLSGSPVKALLPATLFQQVQIERPDVPEDELAGALPWAVKDFVNESVLQLSFDYYDLPTNPAARPRLAVVCVPKSRMQLIAQGCECGGVPAIRDHRGVGAGRSAGTQRADATAVIPGARSDAAVLAGVSWSALLQSPIAWFCPVGRACGGESQPRSAG